MAAGPRGDVLILDRRGAVTGATMAASLSGDRAGIDAARAQLGVPAMAVAARVFVDFDGGGYRAPFAP